jgi:hypothetical protein
MDEKPRHCRHDCFRRKAAARLGHAGRCFGLPELAVASTRRRADRDYRFVTCGLCRPRHRKATNAVVHPGRPG